jgi:type IV pilus assembly protein PilX
MSPNPNFKVSVARQEGVVLFISLIVLVAMSLAGIALMRSVDTATLVTGNLAMKQSSVHSSQLAIAEAAQWLSSNSAGTGLHSSNPGAGYFASAPQIDPDWFKASTWDGGQVAAANGGVADSAGNKIRYVIHRLCTESDAAHNGNGGSGAPNQCARYFPTESTSGGSMKAGAETFLGRPEIFYRLTVRVDGPRGTVTIAQVSLLIPT